MIKNLTLTVGAIIIGLYSFAQTTYPSGVTGCIARWDFTNSGTVTSLPDVSGNGQNGTTTNITTAAGFRNLANKAMSFNGTSSVATVTNSTLLNPSDISIAALVKPNGFYTGNCQGNNIIYKSFTYYSSGWGMQLGEDDGNCSSVSPGTVKLDWTGPSVTSYTLSSHVVNLNKWYFLAVTYTSTAIKRYMVEMIDTVHFDNIAPISTTTFTGGSISANTFDVKIGATQNPSFYYWFNGSIDEIALFNTALPDSNIQSVYNYLWGGIIINKPFNDTLLCTNSNFNVNYTLFNNTHFSSGNVFTVQLSDATGSFAVPTNIGSLTSTNSGTINCTIPSGIPTGTGYRIRIVSSNIAMKSPDNGKNIAINTGPLNLSATTNAPVCAGDTLKLFGSSTSTGVSYSWTGPNSFSSTLQNPVILNATSAANGNYILSATLTNGCTTALDTVVVVVNANPATPVAGSNSPVCTGASINLTSSSTTAGVSYTWNGPASFTSTLQNPSRTGALVTYAGNYTVIATLNGCKSLPANTTVVVNPTPTAPVASSNSPVCTGKSLNLTATTIAGATYNWTGPVGFTSSLQNPVKPSAVLADAGTYNVTASLNGCPSASASVTVSVVTAPYVNIYPSPKDSICVGGSVTLVALPVNAGTTPSYQWFKNNTLIAGANSTSYNTGTSVANNDQFYCVMTSNQLCANSYDDTSITIPIRVLPYLAPSVSITANPTTPVPTGTIINFTATPTNAGNSPAYQWKRNSSNVVGALSNVWGATTLNDKDTICVVVTSNYLCPLQTTAKSNCIVVDIIAPASVNGVGNASPFSLYPNPNTGYFTLSGSVTTNKEINIDIYNAVGQSVYKGVAIPVNGSINQSIKLNDVANGIYILHINTETGNTTFRFRVDK